MLPVKLPDADAVSLALHASFGRLEVSVGAVSMGFRTVLVNGNIAGFKIHTSTNVKDADVVSAIAPSLISGFSKLAEKAPKGEDDLFVDMVYKSKTHDIHETFTVPIRQDKIKQFMTLASKLINMQGRK